MGSAQYSTTYKKLGHPGGVVGSARVTTIPKNDPKLPRPRSVQSPHGLGNPPVLDTIAITSVGTESDGAGFVEMPLWDDAVPAPMPTVAEQLQHVGMTPVDPQTAEDASQPTMSAAARLLGMAGRARGDR